MTGRRAMSSPPVAYTSPGLLAGDAADRLPEPVFAKSISTPVGPSGDHRCHQSATPIRFRRTPNRRRRQNKMGRFVARNFRRGQLAACQSSHFCAQLAAVFARGRQNRQHDEDRGRRADNNAELRRPLQIDTEVCFVVVGNSCPTNRMDFLLGANLTSRTIRNFKEE